MGETVCAWGVVGHDPYYDPCEADCECYDDTCPDACPCVVCHELADDAGDGSVEESDFIDGMGFVPPQDVR